MTNEIAVRLDDEAIALIRDTIAKGCTPDELQLFIQQCNRTQLDPFARQIYAVRRYDGKLRREVMQTQVSIDGARLVAQRSDEYAGQTAVFYCGEDRQWTDLWLGSDGHPLAAKVGVYRRGFVEPLWATATWEQYAVITPGRKASENGPARAPKLSPMWEKMPALMLGKCAEMLALRKAFPMELSGLYSQEEMGQADNPPVAVDQAGKRSPKPRSAPTTPRSAPDVDEDREVDADATQAVIGLIEGLTDEEKQAVRDEWKARGLPSLSRGLTSSEANLVNEVIYDVLERLSTPPGTIDAETVENAQNGDIGGSQATVADPRGTPRPGEEPFGPENETVSRGTSARPTSQISVKQVGMIRAKLGQLGCNDDDEVHERVSEILNVEVTSLNDLTKAQASKVIDHLIDELGE